jgi:hypothetical protein
MAECKGNDLPSVRAGAVNKYGVILAWVFAG